MNNLQSKTFNQVFQKEFEDLRKRFESGEKILVEFNSPIWEEGYLDKGMRAYIVGFGETDLYDMEDGHTDKITEIHFDFSEFSEYNKNLEKPYTTVDGNFGTSSDFDCVPQDFFETSYFSECYEELPFKVLSNGYSSLFKRYSLLNTSMSYIEWLEMQVVSYLRK